MPNDPFAQWRPKSSINESNVDNFDQWRPKITSPQINERSLGKSALRQVGRTGRMVATGIAGLADIPNLASMGLHAAGLKESPTFYKPIGTRVQEGIDTLTGGKLKPENKTEEYMDIVGEGLAPMALSPLTGGSSLTGMVAKGLSKTGAKIPSKIAKLGSNTYKPTASNIGQSVGSSTALKTYIDEGGDPNLLGPVLASILGGSVGRSALSAARNVTNPLNAAAKIAGKATGFSPEKYAHNVELGLPVSISTVSKSNLPNYLEMAASKMPGSMGPLEDFYKSREAAIARNLRITNPNDLEQTVRNIPKNLAKEGAEGYHEKAKNIYKRREENFKTREEVAIKNKEMVDISDIVKDLEDKRSLSLTPAAQKRFDKSKEGILLKELRESIPLSPDTTITESLRKQGYSENIIQKILKAERDHRKTANTGIGLHDLNELREKALHESLYLKTPLGGGTPESRKAAMRSQLLGEKRHQFMEQIGSPSEIHNARQARKFWAKYKDDKNGMSKYVEKITGSKNDAEAFKKLTSTDPKYLNIVRQGLPKDNHSKLAEAIMSDLGERQGRFNINTAYTGFARLEEPVKQQFLKTLPNKAAQNHFETTMKFIGDNKKMMETLANTSNTAHSNHIIDLIKKYGAASAALATGVSIVPLTGLVGTYGGLKLGAKLWTNQKVLKRMNDAITTKNPKFHAKKLDLLIKSIEQTGTHTKHLEK